MTKQTLLILTLILMAILSACGSQSTQTPLEPVTPSEAPVRPTQVPTSTQTILPTSTVAPVIDTPTDIPTEAQDVAVSFANDVQPIFNNSCIRCHGVEQIKEGLDLRSYETLMAGSFNGSVITPGSLDDSYLLQQIINGEMPNRGPKLSAEQIQMIADWINAGAPNN